MAAEMISWPISMKDCCRTPGSNPRPCEHQADLHLNEISNRGPARVEMAEQMDGKLDSYNVGVTSISW